MPNPTHCLSIRSRHSHPQGSPHRQTLRGFAGDLAVVGMLLLGSAAQAEEPRAPQTRHDADRAACQNISPTQDHKACLKEADAVFQASKKNGPIESSGPHSEQDRLRNRTLRCEALPAPEREDCLLRMEGKGTVEGSVNAGGVLRTLERPVAPIPAN
jgi:hypothetical protein